jgi:dihydroorotate dehydrogenase
MVGATRVFVPQDLEFIHATRDAVGAINAHLLPLIAHDRAGFCGALVCCDPAMFLSALYGRPSRSLSQALGLAGLIGFATAIHPMIGCLSVSHLAPAVADCVVFAAGMVLAYPKKLKISRQ